MAQWMQSLKWAILWNATLIAGKGDMQLVYMAVESEKCVSPESPHGESWAERPSDRTVLYCNIGYPEHACLDQ